MYFLSTHDKCYYKYICNYFIFYFKKLNSILINNKMESTSTANIMESNSSVTITPIKTIKIANHSFHFKEVLIHAINIIFNDCTAYENDIATITGSCQCLLRKKNLNEDDANTKLICKILELFSDVSCRAITKKKYKVTFTDDKLYKQVKSKLYHHPLMEIKEKRCFFRTCQSK